jgi:cytochrome c peroxidase
MKFGAFTCLICWIGAACVGSVMTGCLQSSGPEDEAVVISDGNYTPSLPVPPEGWPAIQWPEENRYSAAKAILGRRLFFETALSRDGTVSCSWCHASGHAYTDKHRTALSTGVLNQPTLRNTPTLANVAFASRFLFEGNVLSLEEQVTGPLYAHNEMDMTGPEIVARLASDTLYVRLFRQAYGEDPISMTQVIRALATFERTLVSVRSPYDRWADGDSGALTPAAKRGAALFFGDKARCSRCHTPPLFTDGEFHNNGLDSVFSDSGRARSTGLASDVGRFKTPTVRNVFYSGPYMHDGRIPTLEEVVLHYNAGGVSSATRDTLIRPLGLNEYEIYDLVQFLESLSDLDVLIHAEP